MFSLISNDSLQTWEWLKISKSFISTHLRQLFCHFHAPYSIFFKEEKEAMQHNLKDSKCTKKPLTWLP